MRLNQFLASASDLSRRAADAAIADGQVSVNGQLAQIGQQINPDSDQITLLGRPVRQGQTITIAFNKPIGVVTSRNGQGSRTIYDLLPTEYQGLNPVGRLDKDSSGLLILTNDGHLANRLIHPSQDKLKTYKIRLDRPLAEPDLENLKAGVRLEEGMSQIDLLEAAGPKLTICLKTGWNRQIRRTFAALGYKVKSLERLSVGEIRLGNLATGRCRPLTDQEALWLRSS